MDKCTIIVTYNNGDRKQYIIGETIDNIINYINDMKDNIIGLIDEHNVIYINMDNVNEFKILKK